jgi:hypothetical protein
MAGLFSDLFGTTKSFFKIGGTAGVRLKNSAGDLLVRNTGDTADSAITTSKVNVSGDAIDLNSDAAASGADWKYTVQRPTAGMAAAVTLTLPVDDGTAGQVLSTDGVGVLSWTSAANTSLADKLDTTSLAFGTASPVAMFTTGASDIVDYIDVIIDTAFDGTPTASVGIAGTTSKYLGTTDIDLKAPAGTVFTVHPGLNAQGAEALIITYAAGAATVGAARFIVHYATPA